MSTINEFLNQHYATIPGTEKTAGELSQGDKVTLFAKIAAENGIDLANETDERLDQLFQATFATKEAGEMPPQFAKKDKGEHDDDEKDEKDEKKGKMAPPFGKKEDKDEEAEKKAAAEAEFNEKRAAQQKFEEADFLGRTMAHAYVNEMRKIAAAAPAVETTDKVATAPAESLRDRLMKIAEFPPKKDEKDEKKDDKKDEKSAPPWMKDKEASAFESLAVERAMAHIVDYNSAAEQPFDVKVAADRLAAVATLGVLETDKVASAADAETGLTIRALEYLEAAGYPVNWGG